MPCATKAVNESHLSKEHHLLDQMGEDPVSKAQRGNQPPWGGQLHPHSVTSYDTQLPSAIGSPVFHCPVPVVQGYTSLLPVDTHLKTFTFRWPSKNGEKHFGERLQ